MSQLQFFDPDEGERRRDDAIDRTSEANEDWIDQAYPHLVMLCRKLYTFTSDDIWKACGDAGIEPPGEPRAMAGVFVAGRKAGICEPTLSFLPSLRPACHRRPLRVWRSKLIKEGDHVHQ